MSSWPGSGRPIRRQSAAGSASRRRASRGSPAASATRPCARLPGGAQRDRLHADHRRPEDEVLDAAVTHAVAVHGHARSPELREQLRSVLVDAEPALT